MTLSRYFWPLSLVCLGLGLPVLGQVSPAINVSPSRQFGHSLLTFGNIASAPNLLEGRELSGPRAIAFDTTTTPATVYVADTLNHRVLAWRNPASLTKGNPADKVIGQRDFYSSYQGGPGASAPALTASGLALPHSLAVDSSGNLWVLDAGNNRILRYPKPMEQQGDFVTADISIGQRAPSVGRTSNQGLTKPSAKTLSFNRNSGVLGGSLTFDTQGNLWVADLLNNRVLRFPRASLGVQEPSADVVLGPQNFDQDNVVATDQASLLTLNNPVSVAVDSRDGLYVSDKLGRVLYYANPASGATASRVLGVEPPGTQQQPRPPFPNDYTLGRVGASTVTFVQCVFTLGTVVFVCDDQANRVVRFTAPESWPAPTATEISPAIAGFYGQDTILTGGINRGNGRSRPGGNTFFSPGGGAFYNNEMWIVDTNNNRVLSFPQSGTLEFPNATKVLGQVDFDVNPPNSTDGRELWVAASDFRGSSVAVDRRSNPNRLYVADAANNRILAFRDIRKVGTDSRTRLTVAADLIIGQRDAYHTGFNYPTNDDLIPTDQGLFLPSAVAVDANGNLWVADSGNGRAIRFPDPFAQSTSDAPHADVVLGQASLSAFKEVDPSANRMAQPSGVAVFNNGDVAVADFAHNRVMLFRKNGADFVNGQNARAVLGQQTFSTTTSSNTAAGLNRPKGIAVDTSDRLYVADSSNNRVVVYSNTASTPNGATGTIIPNLSTPEGVAVSPNSGEIWVAAYTAQFIYRFPEFSQLGANPAATAQLSAAGPIGIGLDGFDNIVAVEATNRMTFYYARTFYRHAATYAAGVNPLGSTLAPNMHAALGRWSKDFEFTPTDGNLLPPYPKTVSGIQVLVNGTPAPIFRVDTGAVWFLVPNNAPTAGEAEFLVTRPETGEIVAAGNFLMGRSAPGFFTFAQNGVGQIAATNPDGTPNSPSNPIGQDEVLTLALTGFGQLNNAPPDGEAAGGAFPVPGDLRIIIGGTYIVPADKILYSGLFPEFPGLWQINVRMPKNGEVGAPLPRAGVPILVQMNDVPSNIGGTGGNPPGPDRLLNVQPNGLITTISLK